MRRLVIGLKFPGLALTLLLSSACVVEAGNAGSATTAAGGGKTTNSSKVDIKIIDDLTNAQHQIYLNVLSITFVAAAGGDSIVVSSMPTKLPLGVATASWLAGADLPPGTYQAIQLNLDPKAPGSVVTQGQQAPLTLKGGQHVLQAGLDLTADASAATSLTLKFSSARGITPSDSSGTTYEMAPELLVAASAQIATITGTTTRREPGIACSYLYAPKAALGPSQPIPTFDINLFGPNQAWNDAIGAMAIKLAMAAPPSSALPPLPHPPFGPGSDPNAPFECGNQTMTKAEADALISKNPLIGPMCHPVAMLNDDAGLAGGIPGPHLGRGASLVAGDDLATSIIPPYSATRTDIVLDSAPNCAHAFQVTPVLDGQFAFQTVPGQFVFRVFFASGEVVDVPGAVTVDSGATTEVVVP